MKTIFLLFTCMSLSIMLQAQAAKTINVATPGSLSTLLTQSELATLTDLTLTGTIDARDFWTMRDEMTRLENVDMEGVIIEAYEETDDRYYPKNEVPDGAFCKDFFDTIHTLKSVVLPSTAVNVRHWAFAGCRSLTTISIPATITTFFRCALSGCTGLKSIYCYNAAPPAIIEETDAGLYWGPFDSVDKDVCVLYVPMGSKEIYAYDYFWSVFKNIVEMPGTVLSTSIGAKEGSTASMDISSDFVWTATSNKSWLDVNPDSGTGNKTLTFTAHANTEDTIRIAIVTVLSEDGIKQQLISIVQDALTTGLDEITQNSPLLTCYPNPFIHEIALEIVNPLQREVSVEIYSISGLKIKTLANVLKGANISLSWNGNDAQGKKVVPGVYLLKVNGEVRKVVRR